MFTIEQISMERGKRGRKVPRKRCGMCVCSTPLFHKRSLCHLPKLWQAEFANKKSSYVGAPSQIYLFSKIFWILKMVTE